MVRERGESAQPAMVMQHNDTKRGKARQLPVSQVAAEIQYIACNARAHGSHKTGIENTSIKKYKNQRAIDSTHPLFCSTID